MSSSTLPLYRPAWVMGRYNPRHHCAIVYNAIEGLSYYFEDDSADIVSHVLTAKAGETVDILAMREDSEVSDECLMPFLTQLCQVNLLTSQPINAEGETDYRRRVSLYNRSEKYRHPKTSKEKLPFEMTNAEMAYAAKSGGVTSVMMEVTYNCSEQCIHCYNIGATRNNFETTHRGDLQALTLEQYKDIIDQLYEQGLVKVTLSGGDPFSNPLAWDLIDYLHGKGVAIAIFTNGQKIVDDVERLASYYPVLVGVSIYSSVAQVHDAITRVQGSWEKSMRVTAALSALSVPLVLKCCIMRPNVKTYRGLVDTARRLGTIVQYEVSVTDSVDGDRCVSHFLRLRPEELEIVLRDDNIPLYVGPEAPGYGGQPRDMNVNACGAGHETLCLTPDGSVIPCCAFHLPYGNLTDEPLRDILAHSARRKEWVNATLQDYDECGKYDYCGYYNLCPGQAMSEHGDWRQASENCCYLAKIRHHLAVRMQQGHDPLGGRSIDEALAGLPGYEHPRLHRITKKQ